MSSMDVVVFFLVLALIGAAFVKLLRDRIVFRRLRKKGTGMCVGCPLAKTCSSSRNSK